MEFLAADALKGRGSGTRDELLAALYIASQLRQSGLQPAADKGGFVEEVALTKRKFAVAPQLQIGTPGEHEPLSWKHGTDMLALHIGRGLVQGPLQKMKPDSGTRVLQDGFVLLDTGTETTGASRELAEKISAQGAGVVMIPSDPGVEESWKELGQRLFEENVEPADTRGEPASKANILVLRRAAFERLRQMPDGTAMKLIAVEEIPHRAKTYNVVGRIEGTDSHAAILFSAHLDHLGAASLVGTNFYSGADDDASGVTAVLELARFFASGPRPKRTLLFALFGGGELDNAGAKKFAGSPPLPPTDIVADLDFEMIGRKNPDLPGDTLMLDDWSRSNLGSALV
ncbi:MAG: M28 family peptidase, partial [Acidobacteriales bacterium]|nr:M28 family peptidase [Terriglobales bacterium]